MMNDPTEDDNNQCLECGAPCERVFCSQACFNLNNE